MKLQEIIKDQIFTIDELLSPQECENHISLSESKRYGDAPIMAFMNPVMRPDVRNNKRVIIDNEKEAAALWSKVEKVIPKAIGEYKAVGLNERFRYYRYDIAEYFAWHQDGSFQRGNGEESLMTFMVYLNEEFTGGETEFDLRYPHGEVSIKPKTGMGLIFLHHLRHRGSTVNTGRKYVLRSDMMYKT